MRKKNWLAYILVALVLIIAAIIINGRYGAKPPDTVIAQESKAVNVTEGNSVEPADDGKETAASGTGIEEKDEEDRPEGSSAAVTEGQKNDPSAEPSTKAGSGDAKAASKPTPEPVNVVPDFVDDKVSDIADKDVKAGDYLEIIKIVVGKLSLGEIKYLFDSAKADYWETTSVEDIEKARKMLFSKLSEEDLDQLQQLGKKYGRSMTLLEKDIDVAAVKENQMRKKGLID